MPRCIAAALLVAVLAGCAGGAGLEIGPPQSGGSGSAY